MRNAFATIDCQLSHILGHAVHGGYPADFLRNLQRELLATYWALDEEIGRREAEERPVSGSLPEIHRPGGLLDFLLPADGAA